MAVAQGKEIAPQRRMMDFIERQKGAIEAVATKYLTAEKLLKYVGLALSRNPKLADCTPTSVLKCVITAAQLGLDPSGTLGSAYLIPFKDECTLIIGYRGLVDLIRRYCDIQVEARAVFKGDVFDWSYGTNPVLVHRPGSDWTGHAPSLTHVYAVFTWPDGRKTFEVMTRKEVDRIRFSSKNGQRPPWADDGGESHQGNGYIEMAKKTAVRRGVKLQPLTVEAQDAIAQSDEADGHLDIVADVEASEVRGSQRLADRIAAQRSADAEAELQAAKDAPKSGPDGKSETIANEAGKPKADSKRTGDTKPAAAKTAEKPKAAAVPAGGQISADDIDLDEAADIDRAARADAEGEGDEDLGFN